MIRAITLLAFGITIAAGIDRAVMAQPADLPSDTTVYQEDDGDDLPADPVPYVFTSAGVAI